MFKIKNSTIHCSRGDGGTITLRIPITDVNDYIKYKNNSGSVYWYDNKTKKLYDSNYNETTIELSTLSMEYYQFKVGDVIRFNIYNRNGYDDETLKTKEIIVSEVCEALDIPLTEEDTTFGKVSNKEITYWYDITLNNDLTVVCFDENGAKEFIMYPAKGSNE